MSVGELDEEWEEYNFSGFVPMILAGYRMSAVRRTFPGLERLAKSVTNNVESESAKYLAWCEAHQHDKFPDEPGFFIDLGAAEDHASEMRAATDELPGLLFGSLIVYLLSTLEATLADCLEVAQIVMQRPVMKKVRNPKLENYIRELEGCGIRIGWDDEIWSDLRVWREIRNKIVHTLETPQATRDLSSSAAQEVFWLIDAAIRKLDHAMSALESFTKRPGR
jgi:hypothetical protein